MSLLAITNLSMTTIINIHNSILKKIESGAIRQKPKWQFLLVTLMCMFALIALFLVLLYLVSFAALVLREHLFFDAFSFGPRAVFAVLHTLPFLLVLLTVTVLLILHVLVRHFAFAYMKPVVVTLGGGLLVTFVLFGAVLFMDTNSRIAHFGEGRHVPGIDILHSRFRDRMPPLATHGVVISAGTSTYTIRDENGEEKVIQVTQDTDADQEVYDIGEDVFVLIKQTPQALEAIAIKIYNAAADAHIFRKPTR